MSEKGSRERGVREIPEYLSAPVSGRRQVEEILDILYRRKWLILVVFVLVAAGTAAYSFTQTPIYESRSLIMVDLGRTSLAKGTATGPSVGDNLFATNERSLPGEIFVIQSSTRIAERVRERLGGPQQGYVRFEPASMSVNAMSVTGVSSDPEQAATLANLYAEEYVQLTREASRTHMTTSREFLEQQEEVRRRELREAEDRVQSYIEQNGAISLDASEGNLVGAIATLETQLDDAKVELSTREGSLSALEDELKLLSPQLAQRIASRLDLKLEAVQTKLAELDVAREEILLHNPGKTEDDLANTRLPQINRQSAQLRAELERLSQQYVDEAAATGGITSGAQGLSYVAELKRKSVQERIDINGLKARIGVMQARLAESRSKLGRIPEHSVELTRLERTKTQAEQMYNSIIEQLQAKRIQEETEPGYAHILRRGFVPTSPVGPDHRRNMILGIFFGMMLSLGSALVRDKLDNRIYKPESLRDKGRVVIGVVPDMRPLIKEQFSKATHVEKNGKRYATSLLAMLSPFSMAAESYRHIRTKVQFSIPDRVIRTILITSPGIGEGKSTTAANLAIIMAEADRRTLLIDGDIRRPQLKNMFGMNGAPSLVQHLSGEVDVDADTLQSGIDNLFVLSARRELENKKIAADTKGALPRPSELLGSSRMRDFLRDMKQQFDVIIIDSPPVMAATDAAVLSTQCDATIIVAQAGKTKEAELDDAIESLDDVGATVIGTLLNQFDVSLAYGQKYKYDHYTKYGLYSKYGYYAGTPEGGTPKKRHFLRRSSS